MNILMIAYIDLDKNGGAATHLREVVNNLSKLDNDVTLLCPKFKYKNLVNSKIIDIRGFRQRATKNTIILQCLFSIQMIMCILRNNIDIVYIRHSPFNILPILTSRVMRTPCVIEVNYSIPELKMLLTSNIIIFPIKIIDKISYNLANSIVTVARDLKNHIHIDYNISNDKIFVVPNGANIDEFKPVLSKKAKELLGLNINSRYICYVGGIQKWQGVEFLIKSAPMILEKEPNTKFLIVGKGHYLDHIMRLTKKLNVEKNFIFIQGVSYKNVPMYINAGDICVAPFCKERIASPIKIYEYMACGKPIVAGNISDIGTLLEKSSAGIPIPPNDTVSLAESIIKLLKDEKLRDIMGKNARKYILENCTWDITAKKVLDICNMEIYKNVQ